MKEIYVVPKKYHEWFFVLILILVLIIFSFIDTYDSYYLTSIKEDNKYKVIISYKDKNIFNDSYILLNNKKYRIRNIIFSNPLYENNNYYYYEVTFEADISLEEIEDIKIINNKQRIIEKIKNILIGE